MGNSPLESSEYQANGDGITTTSNEDAPRRVSMFRSVPFQIAVVCGVSFTAPGMWDAMNNLGAGGAAEPYAVSATNALGHALFFIVCIAAGAINGLLSTWLTDYFTVRARAFSSFLTNFAAIFSSFLIAALLDRQQLPIRTRAGLAFGAIVLVLTGTWIWAILLQKQYYDAPQPPVWDWFTDGFNAAYALVFFWTFAGQAFQQFLYWLVGQYTTDLASVSRHTGILRGFEALGQTVAWAMQSEANISHFVSIGVNFGVLLISIFPTWIVLSELGEGQGQGQEPPPAVVAEEERSRASAEEEERGGE